MPFEIITSVEAWLMGLFRILITGAPLQGKTTSLLTLPRPLHVIVAPGESGWSSLPIEPYDGMPIGNCLRGLVVHRYPMPPGATNADYKQAWQDFRDLLKRYITLATAAAPVGPVDRMPSGTPGGMPVAAFAIDGLHKLYYCMQRAMGYGPDTDPREFGRYHEEFENTMSQIMASGLPLVAATCYDGPEAIEGGGAATQVLPDFPGKMARRIMGMFPLVFYMVRQSAAPRDKFYWRLRPQGRIQAAGLHAPLAIVEKLPDTVDITALPGGAVVGGWQTFIKVCAGLIQGLKDAKDTEKGLVALGGEKGEVANVGAKTAARIIQGGQRVQSGP